MGLTSGVRTKGYWDSGAFTATDGLGALNEGTRRVMGMTVRGVTGNISVQMLGM